MPTIEDRVSAAVERLYQLNAEQYRLTWDEDHPQALGPPCTRDQLVEASRVLGMPLPPSYAAFLRLHDGWTEFSGGAMLLPVAEYKKEWVAKRMGRLREHFKEFFDEKILKNAAIVLLGEDERNFAFLDKRTRRADGEMDVVHFDTAEGELGRYPDFAAFLEAEIQTVEEMIRQEQ